MPDIIIVAGPNGAGKTSFANEYLPYEREGLVFLNADEIARELQTSGNAPDSVEIAAGRLMLQRMDASISAGLELMFETTLATLVYQRRIRSWQHAGYSVSLIYLRLPSEEAAIDRVAKRVAAGGHAIPEATIRKRFVRSLDYLERYYKPIVDDWYIWDSLDGDFQLAEAWDE